ncbi:hypothetical protein AM493_11005 [Flavobacterium akiainvivens]|uniref:Uncharacterized protein n=1 Tax=Flavobacterium akiainvivens TaxID=1202724 RepID=A0A0M8MDF1_9FLAO|nr:hypothetical protein [Flavobacterium akiainvivens]KOS06504.1 hypothetical protein AM493_11005 [Flavobacterium akiainvivens]SFQ11883.1 hypothetical protein SAMN05444144_101159 [Flavobacterium akiainvivens]
MKKLLFVILIPALFSCKEMPKQPKHPVVEEVAEEPTLAVTTFPLADVPEDMIGCTTGLFLSQHDKTKNNFVFINDFEENAIVGINGKQVKFKLEESPEGSHTYIYGAEGYKLTIKITKEVQSGYENADVEAEFLLQRGSSILRKTLVGYRGC